jgi:hypothetical protein
MIGIRNDDDIFLWTNFQKTIAGLLYQRFSDTENIKKLFGGFITTHGPETATYAACHDYTIIIIHRETI